MAAREHDRKSTLTFCIQEQVPGFNATLLLLSLEMMHRNKCCIVQSLYSGGEGLSLVTEPVNTWSTPVWCLNTSLRQVLIQQVSQHLPETGVNPGEHLLRLGVNPVCRNTVSTLNQRPCYEYVGPVGTSAATTFGPLDVRI